MLRAFTHVQTDRFFTKAERTLPECFSLVFTAGNNELPVLRGLNFNNAERAFIVMPTAKKDTITYWIKDSALINQDTLRMQMQYWSTDTTGQLRMKQDTIEVLAKTPYAKRLKEKQKKRRKNAALRSSVPDSAWSIPKRPIQQRAQPLPPLRVPYKEEKSYWTTT